MVCNGMERRPAQLMWLCSMVPSTMSVKTHFPLFSWFAHRRSGPWARRIYIVGILIVLCLNAAARLRSYFMAQRIQAVLHGLSEIRVDQTTEEQLLKTVPYLTRTKEDWKAGGIVQRRYYAEISNDSDRLMSPAVLHARWSGRLGYWFGYRYIDFGAGLLVQDGRVTSVGYGLSRQWVQPKAVGYIVSAKSVHGFWLPYRLGFEVTSQDDESPQYRFEHVLWNWSTRNRVADHGGGDICFRRGQKVIADS